MKQISLSTNIKCSRCGEHYELGDITRQTGSDIPWLVVKKGLKNIDEVFANTTCQMCHGHKTGLSVKDALHILGVQITDSVISDHRPKSTGFSSDSFIGTHRPTLTSNNTQAETQQHSVFESDVVFVGAMRPKSRSGKQTDSGQNVRKSNTRQHNKQHVNKVVSDKGSIYNSLKVQLDRALETGKDCSSLVSIACKAGIDHKLVRDYLAKEIRSNRARFAALTRSFKRKLKHLRVVSEKQECTDLVDQLYDILTKANLSDPKKRSKNKLLSFFGTNHVELGNLATVYYSTKTIVPSDNGAKCVDRVGFKRAGLPEETKIHIEFPGVSARPSRLYYHGKTNVRVVKFRESEYAKQSKLVTNVLCENYRPVKIVYPEGEMYGNNPCIELPDDKYRFTQMTNRKQTSQDSWCVSEDVYMGAGMKLVMSKKDNEWIYTPITLCSKRVSKTTFVGKFSDGYVSTSSTPMLFMDIKEPLIMLQINDFTISSVLMKNGSVRVFESVHNVDSFNQGIIIIPVKEKSELSKEAVVESVQAEQAQPACI